MLSGTLDFSATPVSFPNVPGDGFRLSTPFSFQGFVRGTTDGHEVFAASLLGSGDALRFFDRIDGHTFGAGENHQVFLFDSASDQAPVPEPGTMLLLGTGGAWLAARGRRRVRQS